MTSNNYHATPYDTSAQGFYFYSFEDYEAKARNHRNEFCDLIEEFEIQFIDSDMPWAKADELMPVKTAVVNKNKKNCFKRIGVSQKNNQNQKCIKPVSA